ncbi:hypothetical protein FT688_14345 [Aeromonas hydrophila]|nr:hypothetical protein FT688_14345 [Aeromonas hydrophila]
MLADNATVDALAAGQQHTEQFTVSLSDGSTTTVTITITGTDDAPVISADTGAVTEGDQTPVTGTLTASDADNPGLTFVAGNESRDYGRFEVGRWQVELRAGGQRHRRCPGCRSAAHRAVHREPERWLDHHGHHHHHRHRRCPVISADTGAVTEGIKPRSPAP